jgi:hypothetical protein
MEFGGKSTMFLRMICIKKLSWQAWHKPAWPMFAATRKMFAHAGHTFHALPA